MRILDIATTKNYEVEGIVLNKKTKAIFMFVFTKEHEVEGIVLNKN